MMNGPNGKNLNDLANKQNLKKTIWKIHVHSRSLFSQKGQNKNLVNRPVKLTHRIFYLFDSSNCWRKRRH